MEAVDREPTRHIHSFDGTRIAVHERGGEDGQPIVLCNGLGGGFTAWSRLIELMGPGYRYIGFDYRGLDASGPAPSLRAYRVRDHARDLAEIVDQLEIERPVIIGWSMGVQVMLELHRSHPHIPAAAVALFGAAGRPLDSAFDTPWSKRLLDPLFRGLQFMGGRSAAIERLAELPGVSGGVAASLQGLGWMASHADLDAFHQLVLGFGKTDSAIYGRIFEELGLHDASSLVPGIQTPSLVVAGEADRMIPPHIVQRLADDLPRGRFERLARATHFGVIEEAEAIAHSLRRFLNDELAVD